MLETPFASPSVAKLWQVLPEARIAGGAVRDALAGRAIADVDFASPLTPAAVIARLDAAGIKSVPTGLAHGTVTAIIGGRGFEITTLRRDLATDGRHAVVAFTDDWEVDAGRRDFTINAMSAGRDGTIFDYFSGRDDLAAGRVRFVGDADARIQEDYLRILRFFRFFARYGQGHPDAGAVAAIARCKSGLRQLSVERIWNELKFLLLAADPGPAVRLMQTTGVLPEVLPQADFGRFEALLARAAPADPVLRIAALSGENVPEFSARLKLSGEEHEKLDSLRRPNTLTPAADDAMLRRALAAEPPATLSLRTWLASGDADWDHLRRRIAATPRPVFPLQGRDLTSRGIPPGPEIGRLLQQAHQWWLDGGCIADAKACLAQIGLT